MRLVRRLTEAPGSLALGTIRLYKLVLSPLLPPACRFEPTCSVYAGEAIGRFGLRRGAWLALRRLARCHPWGGFGYDPVPDTATSPAHPALCRSPSCRQ